MESRRRNPEARAEGLINRADTKSLSQRPSISYHSLFTHSLSAGDFVVITGEAAAAGAGAKTPLINPKNNNPAMTILPPFLNDLLDMIFGSLNVIMDGLSRRNQIQHTEWSLCPQIFKQIAKLWEHPQVDLFATRLNAKFPLYVFPIPDEQAWAVEVFNMEGGLPSGLSLRKKAH